MNFVKMHGLGNDYILIEDMAGRLDEASLPEFCREICDRHFGVGGDGLLIAKPSETADFRMVMLNSDGSEGEMCGNGVRCFAKFVRDSGLSDKMNLDIETGAGNIHCIVLNDEGSQAEIRVNMGTPRFRRPEIPMLGRDIERVVDERITADGKDFFVFALSMGNPHCVVLVDTLDEVELLNWGPALETHSVFPRRTNVEFVEVLGISRLKMLVWERGAGATLACGTGACAAVVAAAAKGMIGRRADVDMPGGTLRVEWDDDEYVWLTGPCTVAFRGCLAGPDRARRKGVPDATCCET